MRKLSFLIFVIFFAGNLSAQSSPHGTIQFDCSDCHVSSSWKEIPAKKNFKHEATKFSLVGQHKNVECKLCHETLKFAEAQAECVSCHKDIHQNTVSRQCSNCHSPNAWLIKNITDIHQRSRFPLLGQHAKADCQRCHTGYSELNFEPLGVKCYDCHRQNYALTQKPNHVQSGFSTDCESCHNFTDANWGYASFAHDKFPLIGGHRIGYKIADCKACHINAPNYSGLSQDCYSCHKTHFEQTTNPNHISATFSTTCTECHTINSWKPSSFNHTQYFVFEGAHTQLDCNKCHSTSYKNTPTDCYGCHKANFEATTNPNHVTSQFPKTCNTCHSTTSWIPSTFNHSNTTFPLTGAHTTVDCTKCHASGYIGTSTDCYSCHKTTYNNTTAPGHLAANFPTDCTKCHSTTAWIPSTFNHANTTFPLTGAHTTVDCAKCHAGGYTGTSTDCYSCHKTNYDATTNPNHVASKFPTTCTVCHSTTAWIPATFDHSTTQFPLTGAHTTVDCAKCHANGYTGTSTDCYSCHKANYDATTNPNHSTAGFSTDCKSCHQTTAWTPATFDHSKYFPIASGKHGGISCTTCHPTPPYSNFTCLSSGCHPKSSTDNKHIGEVNGYSYVSSECYRCHPTGRAEGAFNHSNSRLPLTGSHLTTPCESCHIPNSTAALSPDCTSCHQNSFVNSASPNHQQLGLSTDCKSCHTADGWKPSSFNHSTSAFQLTGKHTTAACSDCHKGKTVGTSQVCDDCHQESFTNSVNPNHQTTGLSTDCKTCHTSEGWKPSTFNHAATNFQLVGKHLTTSCSDCHKGQTTGTSQVCNDCHQQSFANSVSPNHQATGLSTDCKTCHTSEGWKPSLFDHAATKFLLAGKHLTTNCSDCHKGQTTGTSQICNDCHQQSFANSVNPNHQSIGLSTDCKTCHVSDGWIPSSFSHATTNFQLVGGHTKANCSDCHKGKTTGTSQICNDCHQQSFANSVNPNHQSIGLSTDCKTCHTSAAWIPSSFDHSTTKFQLTGGHTVAACADCHVGKTTGTDTQCFSCHKSNYDGVQDPNHVSSNFSTDCTTCHSTTAWIPSTFNHTTTKFPLTGAHTSVDCVKCHASGYTNTPTDCYSCHKTKYDATTNPKHTQTNYPSGSCQTCHKTTAWTPATFDHSKYFPISSGKHSGKSCSVCHSSPIYSNFTCISSGCHSKSGTDSDHRSVNGYSYVSSECYRCHPTGRGGQIKGFIKSIEN